MWHKVQVITKQLEKGRETDEEEENLKREKKHISHERRAGYYKNARTENTKEQLQIKIWLEKKRINRIER